MNGTIKNITPRSYGFIRGINGVEYFFHRSDFNGFWEDLQADALQAERVKVSFDVVDSDKGPRAANVKRTQFPNEAA